MDIQPSFKADSQLAKACKPAVHPLHHPLVFAQALAALNASSGNAANDAPLPQVGSASLEVVAFCRRAALPVFYGDVLAGQQSQESRPRTISNIVESCRFAPLTKITSGMPLASTTICRLEPSLPLSVGFGARFLPLGLGTEESSWLARLQSIWSCSRKQVCMA